MGGLIKTRHLFFSLAVNLVSVGKTLHDLFYTFFVEVLPIYKLPLLLPFLRMLFKNLGRLKLVVQVIQIWMNMTFCFRMTYSMHIILMFTLSMSWLL